MKQLKREKGLKVQFKLLEHFFKKKNVLTEELGGRMDEIGDRD